jgi:RimJ/RimL family protein N-acetyltransferase
MMLETPRLRLRPLTINDTDALFGIWGDAETMKFYPAPYLREEVVALIEKQLQRYAAHGTGLWALELKETGAVIGDAGLLVQDVDGQAELEIAYHLRRDRWGNGFATEAALACRDFAFSELGKTRLISLVRPENVPSQRVAERVGMTVERETVRASLRHLVYVIER